MIIRACLLLLPHILVVMEIAFAFVYEVMHHGFGADMPLCLLVCQFFQDVEECYFIPALVVRHFPIGRAVLTPLAKFLTTFD